MYLTVVFVRKFRGLVSQCGSVMSVRRPRFDVGALMKARKEAKQLHKQCVECRESVEEKKLCLHNLHVKEKDLDCKVSCLI